MLPKQVRFSRSQQQLYTYMLLIVVLLLATACGASPEQQTPTSTPIPTAPAAAPPTYAVQRGDVEDVFEFSGRWQPRDQEPLAFDVAGTARRVNVQRGDTVSAGDLLADLQIDDLEDQLASAQLTLAAALAAADADSDNGVQSVTDAEFQLASANLALESAKNNLPWTSTQSAAQGVDTAEAGLADAQRAYDNAVSHPEAQGAAQAVEGAYQALLAAQRSLQSAQTSYYSSAQGYNNAVEQLKGLENSVLQAELNLQKAHENAATGSSNESVQSAQLQIEQIEEQIARSSLYAPADGVVLDVTIAPGDAVTAYEAVISIGRPEPKEAIASLAFSDAQNLSLGLVGVCNILNEPESAVQCIVRRMPLSAQDADQTTQVAATLPDAADGQLIEIRMPLEVSTNVLWLPPAAIRTFQNRTFVVLQTPDGPRRQDIEIGLQTDERVEIVSGLNEGDVVIGE